MFTSNIRVNALTQTSNLSNNFFTNSQAGPSRESKIERSIVSVNNVQASADLPCGSTTISTLPIGPCRRCFADGENINSADEKGDTALILAANSNDVEKVKSLLQTPFIDINKANLVGLTALHCAALGNHVDVVLQLIEAKEINLNTIDENGHTALMLAAGNGYHDCVTVLCEDSRCNINAEDLWGRSALVWAHPYPAIVETLLQHQPNIVIDTKTRLPLWVRDLPSVSTILCCRKPTVHTSEENAGFMLTPRDRAERDDDIT